MKLRSLHLQYLTAHCMLAALVILAGCLISEIDEYRIKLNDDGKSGTMTILKRNIESDQTDPVKQAEDFDQLIQDWKGEQYLLDKTKEGVYVKERRLYLEREQLVWKEVSIFSEFNKLFRDEIINDTIRIMFKNDETVLATNGILVQTRDSSIVLWPTKTKEFVLKTRRNDFKATSHFAAKFKALAKKK